MRAWGAGPRSSLVPLCWGAGFGRTHLCIRLQPRHATWGPKKKENDLPGTWSPPLKLYQPDHLRKEKTLPTHTHSYNPQSHLVLQPGHPGVFAGPGRDAGEKSTGSTQGRNQPWETHGQGEEEESEESPCKNPEVGHFLAESTRACGRLLAQDPSSSLTDTRVPRAQLRPRSSSATLRAQDDASSPPEAALGFFVYIRARWQTALARLSQAGH